MRTADAGRAGPEASGEHAAFTARCAFADGRSGAESLRRGGALEFGDVGREHGDRRGLLFQLKGTNIPPHAQITVDVHRPLTVIEPVDAAGDTGVLDGFKVMIVSPSGTVLEQRSGAREHLQNASLTTTWDRLSLVYFLGYAFWGYYSLPYQLTRPVIQWTELSDGVLQADYGTSLPVHSRIQRFWFDKKTGLLKRNDYTPVAASTTARAANLVFEHGVSHGIAYTSKRRVKMSLSQYGWVLPFPDFITIDVERWQLR